MSDQYLLSLTLIALLGLFVWGKVRYDALAIGALFVLVVLDIIPANQAFAGFAHPAVITVALVLIISQGLSNSGIAGLVGKLIGGREFTEIQFMVSLLFIAALLSSFINNIGALAILLPITLNLSKNGMASIKVFNAFGFCMYFRRNEHRHRDSTKYYYFRI